MVLKLLELDFAMQRLVLRWRVFSFDWFSKYLLSSFCAWTVFDAGNTGLGKTVLFTDFPQRSQSSKEDSHHRILSLMGGLLLNQMAGEQCSYLKNHERLQRESGI